MKKIIAVVYFTGLLFPFLYGQSCKDAFLGSKTLYQAQQKYYSAVPKGYHPVFINHVGRHGARHLTKNVGTAYLYQLVLQADSLGGLSATGKLLKEKLLRLENVEGKNIKSISEQGKKEQQQIAGRMFTNNNHVFNTVKPVLQVCYTKEIRTLQTSEAFLDKLTATLNGAIVNSTLNDTTLRFYDICPAYDVYKEKGNWTLYLQQVKKSVQYDALAGTIMQYFFLSSFLKNVTVKDTDKCVADLFGFISIFSAIQNEVAAAGYKAGEVNMRSFLNGAQLLALGKIDNAEDFLEKGPGSNVNGIQVKIAIPLLADFIRSTDEYISTKTVNAQLRFAHAETIAPYAALLGFTAAAVGTKNPTDIYRVWKADKIIPLSANIQWILYHKPGSEKYLVKFLLNEKETAIKGLATTTFPYYNWNEVRSFYLKKLTRFDAGLNTNFVQYLKKVN
jgi:multiple inositol-polyphosphate phosphatase/2,3-bisphosphoglycerate 3-phosphatase